MLQILYVSSVRAAASVDIGAILLTSRRNNDRDGITGLLYADGRRFLQVLEGPADRVDATLARIAADPRHYALVELGRRTIEVREFGDWAMAHRGPGEDGDLFLAQIAERLSAAAPNIRATFEGLAKIRRAA